MIYTAFLQGYLRRAGSMGLALGFGLSLSFGMVKEAIAASFTFTSIATSNSLSNLTLPTLNNHGTVAFTGRNQQGYGVFTGDGQQVSTIFDTAFLINFVGVNDDPSLWSKLSYGRASINDQGQVAATGSFLLGDYYSEEIILTNRRGQQEVIHSKNSNDYLKVNALNPVITNSGNIFYQYDSFFSRPWVSAWEQQIWFNALGAQPIMAYDVYHAFSDGFYYDMSPNGNSFLSTVIDKNNEQIYATIVHDQEWRTTLENEFPVTTVTTRRIDPFTQTVTDVDPNTVPSTLMPLPVQLGDSLFGSVITALAGGSRNTAGQIAFLATLANGQSMIVRADPQLAPEINDPEPPQPVPESFNPLFLLGLLGLIVTVRRCA